MAKTNRVYCYIVNLSVLSWSCFAHCVASSFPPKISSLVQSKVWILVVMKTIIKNSFVKSVQNLQGLHQDNSSVF